MNTRTIRLNRFNAAACAAVITTLSAWAFMSSTASIERDPFQFASIMTTNAEMQIVQSIGRQGNYHLDVRGDAPPDLLATLPACLRVCA